MNLIDLFFIMFIVVVVFEGAYRGFLHSSLSLGTFFLSIITSYIFYPIVSAAIKANETMFNFIFYYTEGAEKIASFKDASLLVNNLSQAKLDNILSTASLTEPFTTLIRQNVETKAFASGGLQTIGEYFNMTIVCTVLNVFSFLLIFLLTRILLTFVLGAVNYTVQFPELKQYDRSTGALFGLSRGIFACFLVAMVIPIIFLIVPVDKLIEYFQASPMGTFFYQNNFFFHLIRGIA